MTPKTKTSSGNGSAPSEHFDVLVVGGGFAGIGTAIKLEENGFDDFVVLEKAEQLGGTWRDNTYPGCSCDVPSALYSFSFALNPDWSRVYAEQPEIQEYLLKVADDYGVRGRVRFGSELLDAQWNPDETLWQVSTTRGNYTARVLIAGAGPLHEPNLPDIPGIDSFKGTIFHSGQWNHEHDLTGERVAVLGTGSSAIQFVPMIQPKLGQLYLFQRTAPWVLPKFDREIKQGEKDLYRRFPAVQRALRNTLYNGFELVQRAQRKPHVMQRLEKVFGLHLKRQVKDPKLRAQLTPHFTLGCKRMLFSNTYYLCLQEPNAELVPHGVTEVREQSVVDSQGVEREVDTIILGTGFHVTDPPIANVVRGPDGRSIADGWAGSPRGYLGTTVAGFPNYFQLIGPNIANGHSSALVLIEAQLRYIVDALRTMKARGMGSVEIRRDVQDSWNARIQEALAGTVWNAGGCNSYYLDRNGTNSTIYPWSTIDLRRRTAQFDPANYVLREATPQPVAA